MTDAAHDTHDTHADDAHAHHGPPARTGIKRWTGPGWYRVLWCMPLFFVLGSALVCLIRWAATGIPIWDGSIITSIALVTVPFGFLTGLGGFDYWARYASGKPTIPDDHSGHGARRWQDYFRVNSDHKVIGMQYLVTIFIFFMIGGFLAMLFRAELAQPGTQYFNPQTFNGLITNHATLMIFLVIVPGFAASGTS